MASQSGGELAFLFERSTWSRIRQIVEVNIVAMLRLSHHFLPAMISRGHGAILNIGSGAGYAAVPNAAVYTASKHFVRAFTESLRAQLAGTGVTYRKPRQGLWNLSSTKLLVLKAVRLQGKAFSESLRKNAPADIVREFERASPVIFPGRNYRWLMKMQPLMPRRLVATHVAQAARQIRYRETKRAA